MFDWNDLRYFLAVAESGSTLAAARALRVSQTTVARRIAALEAAMGLTLFERRQAGYALTPVGEAMLASAISVRDAADRFGAFGLSLGIGFQVRDDLLGIWGSTATTGKAEADDIRRRKQSLPILMLRERASEEDRATLDLIYADDEIDEQGIRTVLELLDRSAVRADLEHRIAAFHDDARPALVAAALARENGYRDAMEQLVDVLSNREH